MATSSYHDYVSHWGHIDTRMQANPELSIFEPLRLQLEAERLGLASALSQQAMLKARAQNASRQIDTHVARGRDLMTRLHDALRAYYGRTSENLTEFHLNPRRPRKPIPPAPTPEDKKPSDSGPNPSQTAAPGTDGSIVKE